MEKFQNDFNAAGGRQFGSGWVFVTVAKDGKLAIETRPNQDNPIMDGKRALMGNDVWEHAYYLNYQNRRADYLKAWWNTVNWKQGRRALCRGKDRHARRLKQKEKPGAGQPAPGFLLSCRRLAQAAMSKRSAFITLVHAATKSFANFSFESAHA